VDGGSEDVWLSALLSFESLYLLLQLLNHRLLMQDNPHQLLWRQLLEAFRSRIIGGMHHHTARLLENRSLSSPLPEFHVTGLYLMDNGYTTATVVSVDGSGLPFNDRES